MWCRHGLLSSTSIQESFLKAQLFQYVVLNSRFLSETCRAVNEEEQANSRSISPSTNVSTKIIKVALIGRPNTGKSTLINQIVGRTTCPVSMKAHTTRSKVKAFVNDGDTQIVFLDTPGLVSPQEIQKYNFEPSFLRSAEEAALEADILGVMQDGSFTRSTSLDPTVVRLLLHHQRKSSFLIINKVDAIKKKASLLHLAEALTKKVKVQIPKFDNPSEEQNTEKAKTITSWPYFNEVFMVSALEGDGVGDIKEYLLNNAVPGRWLIEERESMKPEILAVNLVKAACLDFLPDEVPYKLDFKLNYYEDYGDKCAVEVAVIPSNRRHERMTMNKVRPISAYAEVHLASAIQKECRLRVNIKHVTG